MWIKRKTLGLWACLTVVVPILSGCAEKEPESPRLNVIYIMADDLGYGDIEPYGQTKIHTPHLKRLRERGMLFTQCYAGTAVSVPSRCSFLTGLHTGHAFVRGSKSAFPSKLTNATGSMLEGQVAMPKGTFTLSSMFKSMGYATGCFGIWGLGYPGSESDPVLVGFDKFFGYNCQTLAHNYYPDHLWDGLMRVEMKKNRFNQNVSYSADLIHREAMDFLRSNGNKPFFAFLSYTLPHAELVVPHDYTYAQYCKEIPMEDETPYLAPETKTAGRYRSSERPLASYAAMVTRLDNYVGEVMDMLDSLGIADRTLLVFSSDHGPHSEGGANPEYFKSYGSLRGIKRDLYEGGLRIPMIMSCPGLIAEGSESDHLMALWDMMPTLAELVGYEEPLKSDGISICPTLLGQEGQIEHNYLYWEFHEKEGKQAVREGKWKGICLHVESDEPSFELYDLSTDPHEDVDVSSFYPEIVGHLQQLMDHCHAQSDLFNFGR